jgi:hypothetical protein
MTLQKKHGLKITLYPDITPIARDRSHAAATEAKDENLGTLALGMHCYHAPASLACGSSSDGLDSRDELDSRCKRSCATINGRMKLLRSSRPSSSAFESMAICSIPSCLRWSIAGVW